MSRKKDTIIYGSKTLAEIAYNVARSNNDRIRGFVDDDSKNDEKYNLPVYKSLEDLFSNHEINKINFFIAIGDNKTRSKISHKLTQLGCSLSSILHKNATIGYNVKIGPGCLIDSNSTIGHNSIIGQGVIIMPNVTISHDVQIGDYSWFSVGSRVGGFSKIGLYNKLKMNSVVNSHADTPSEMELEPLNLYQ